MHSSLYQALLENIFCQISTHLHLVLRRYKYLKSNRKKLEVTSHTKWPHRWWRPEHQLGAKDIFLRHSYLLNYALITASDRLWNVRTFNKKHKLTWNTSMNMDVRFKNNHNLQDKDKMLPKNKRVHVQVFAERNCISIKSSFILFQRDSHCF